jgi:RimJ/RimL family protein N-acetyltransferase
MGKFEPILQTDRLLLVNFTEAHVNDFAAMNGDAEVMEFFPATQSPDESAAFLARIMVHREQHGYSLFALHLKQDDKFVGFTGLLRAEFSAHFTPAVEIGWRLPKFAWGQGLGPEAARACLTYGFESLALDEIVSFTAAQNKRSIRVMEKIGMQNDAADDFDHPHLGVGHWLRRHVLYRKRRFS